MSQRQMLQFSSAAIVAAILLVIVVACEGGSSPSTSSIAPPVTLLVAAYPTAPPGTQPPKVANLPSLPGSNGNVADVKPAQQGRSGQRIILKNAALAVTVTDVTKVINQVTQLAETSGGWVVASNLANARTDQNNTAASGTISIRVPADQLTTALAQIRSASVSVDSEVITGDDVTQQYVDLSSQLTNLQSTEAQLQKIMATATNVNDVLAVQNQLTTVQGQIEGIQGKLKYFSEAAAYSLISLTLTQKAPVLTPTPTMTPTITPTPTPKAFGLSNWHPQATLESAVDLLVSTIQVIISLVIWGVVFGGPFVIVALILFLIWRAARNRVRLSKSG